MRQMFTTNNNNKLQYANQETVTDRLHIYRNKIQQSFGSDEPPIVYGRFGQCLQFEQGTSPHTYPFAVFYMHFITKYTTMSFHQRGLQRCPKQIIVNNNCIG